MSRMKPMLASVGSESLLTSDDYWFEPKLDGIRALCYVDGAGVRLYSRNDNDITSAYPEIRPGDAFSFDDAVIDGEIVLYDAQGNPDFHSLIERHHRRIAPRGGRPVTFVAFDLLRREGRILVDAPLEERRSMLNDGFLAAHTAGEHHRIETTVFTREGEKLWRIMTERGQEGVIAKRRGSRYQPGRRSDAWLKIKAYRTAEAVIIGYRSDRRPISSLALGLYDGDGDEGDKLVVAGRVGTGFSDAETRKLRAMLDPISRTSPPVTDAPRDYRDVNWTEPEYVCEIRYLSIGSGGAYRHPSFLRLRPDKDPKECRVERP